MGFHILSLLELGFNLFLQEGKSQPKEVIVEEEGEKKDDDAAAAADALVEDQEKSSEAETLLERLQENNSTESPPEAEIEEEKLRYVKTVLIQFMPLVPHNQSLEHFGYRF